MLSKRLNCILDLVINNKSLADVGCDHAYLCCSAIINNKTIKAYAMDNKEKPLLKAKNTINKYNLNNNITTILSNGLDKLPDDVEVVVIAGIGFDTCKDILINNIDKVNKLKQLIIQINNDTYKLREWLSLNRFKINNEKVVFDYKYYQVLSITPNIISILSNDDIYFGPILKHDKSSIYKEYLKEKKIKYQTILSKIDKNTKKYKTLIKSIDNVDNLLNKK